MLFDGFDIQYQNWQNLYIDIRCTVLVVVRAVCIPDLYTTPTIWTNVCSGGSYGASGEMV